MLHGTAPSYRTLFLFCLQTLLASASVLSYVISSSIFLLQFITHTIHFFLLMSIPIFLILFITSLQTVFSGLKDAITYQCARHGNAASRITPFKLKCAKHSFIKGSIHHLDYDGDVFTCIQDTPKTGNRRRKDHVRHHNDMSIYMGQVRAEPVRKTVESVLDNLTYYEI